MDPSVVTSDSKLIVGEIEIAVKYKTYEENLLVKICKAKNLRNTESFGLPDPYVIVEMYTKRWEKAFNQNSFQIHLVMFEVLTSRQRFCESPMSKVTGWEVETLPLNIVDFELLVMYRNDFFMSVWCTISFQKLKFIKVWYCFAEVLSVNEVFLLENLGVNINWNI